MKGVSACKWAIWEVGEMRGRKWEEWEEERVRLKVGKEWVSLEVWDDEWV